MTHVKIYETFCAVSKGGSNELGNLGVTCKEANMAKGDMTTGEFIDLCIEVLSHHGYKID